MKDYWEKKQAKMEEGVESVTEGVDEYELTTSLKDCWEYENAEEEEAEAEVEEDYAKPGSKGDIAQKSALKSLLVRIRNWYANTLYTDATAEDYRSRDAVFMMLGGSAIGAICIAVYLQNPINEFLDEYLRVHNTIDSTLQSVVKYQVLVLVLAIAVVAYWPVFSCVRAFPAPYFPNFMGLLILPASSYAFQTFFSGLWSWFVIAAICASIPHTFYVNFVQNPYTFWSEKKAKAKFARIKMLLLNAYGKRKAGTPPQPEELLHSTPEATGADATGSRLATLGKLHSLPKSILNGLRSTEQLYEPSLSAGDLNKGTRTKLVHQNPLYDIVMPAGSPMAHTDAAGTEKEVAVSEHLRDSQFPDDARLASDREAVEHRGAVGVTGIKPSSEEEPGLVEEVLDFFCPSVSGDPYMSEAEKTFFYPAFVLFVYTFVLAIILALGWYVELELEEFQSYLQEQQDLTTTCGGEGSCEYLADVSNIANFTEIISTETSHML
eukprot:gene24545-29858_t